MKLIYEKELSQIFIGRKVAENFLEELEAQIETGFGEFEYECTCNHKNIVNGMKNSLKNIFFKLNLLYINLQKQDLVGDMEFIYLSFLRSAILTNSDVYQLNVYDRKGRSSTVECVCRWDCIEIFQGFYNLKRNIETRFRKQMKINEYVLDKRLIELGETMNEIAKPFIIDAIKQLAEDEYLWEDKLPVIMIGEFLDKSDEIIGGANGILYNETGH
ncbi:hypothetical protein ACOAOT_14945 [Lacrimispora sp. AGF001]|uniref:hypothetical protein n=1 Tax=Lacrimispora sp. AGF001 TaxID=3401631 RepID=UPI003B42B5F6